MSTLAYFWMNNCIKQEKEYLFIYPTAKNWLNDVCIGGVRDLSWGIVSCCEIQAGLKYAKKYPILVISVWYDIFYDSS